MKRLIGLAATAGLAALLAACGPTQQANTPAATTAAVVTSPTAARPVTSPAATPTRAATPAATPLASPRTASPAATPATPRLASPVASPATPRLASPAASPRAGSPVASPAAGIGRESSGNCEVRIPEGFRDFAGAGEGFWTDGAGLLVLAPVATEGQDFATFTQNIPSRFANDPNAPGFQQIRTESRPDRYRIDFTLAANPSNPLFAVPSAGTLVAAPGPGGSGQVCVAQLFYPQGQEAKYGPLADQVAASLRSARP